MRVINRRKIDGIHVCGDMVGGDLDGEEVFYAVRYDTNTEKYVPSWVGPGGWVSVDDCDPDETERK